MEKKRKETQCWERHHLGSTTPFSVWSFPLPKNLSDLKLIWNGPLGGGGISVLEKSQKHWSLTGGWYLEGLQSYLSEADLKWQQCTSKNKKQNLETLSWETPLNYVHVHACYLLFPFTI